LWEILKEKVTWKTRRRWEDNIKMTLIENRREGVDWFNLAPERYKRWAAGNTETKRRVPENAEENYLTS